MKFLAMRASVIQISCCICGEKPDHYPVTSNDRFGLKHLVLCFGCADHAVRKRDSSAAGMCLVTFWNLQNTVLSAYVRRYL